MLSPIQVRRHWLRKVSFEPLEAPPENQAYAAQISIRHEKLNDGWSVWLKVAFGGQASGKALHNGEIEFEGIFAVHPKYPDDKIEDLVRMNGGAILYGAVRELVLNLTARSKHGPFEMPTIDARMFLKPPEEKTAPKPAKKSKPKRKAP